MSGPGHSGKRPTPCRFFSSGNCVYGDNCRNLHQQPSQSGLQNHYQNGPHPMDNPGMENDMPAGGPPMGGGGDQYFNATFNPAPGSNMNEFTPFRRGRPRSAVGQLSQSAKPFVPQGPMDQSMASDFAALNLASGMGKGGGGSEFPPVQQQQQASLPHSSSTPSFAALNNIYNQPPPPPSTPVSHVVNNGVLAGTADSGPASSRCQSYPPAARAAHGLHTRTERSSLGHQAPAARSSDSQQTGMERSADRDPYGMASGSGQADMERAADSDLYGMAYGSDQADMERAADSDPYSMAYGSDQADMKRSADSGPYGMAYGSDQADMERSADSGPYGMAYGSDQADMERSADSGPYGMAYGSDQADMERSADSGPYGMAYGSDQADMERSADSGPYGMASGSDQADMERSFDNDPNYVTRSYDVAAQRGNYADDVFLDAAGEVFLEAAGEVFLPEVHPHDPRLTFVQNCDASGQNTQGETTQTEGLQSQDRFNMGTGSNLVGERHNSATTPQHDSDTGPTHDSNMKHDSDTRPKRYSRDQRFGFGTGLCDGDPRLSFDRERQKNWRKRRNRLTDLLASGNEQTDKHASENGRTEVQARDNGQTGVQANGNERTDKHASENGLTEVQANGNGLTEVQDRVTGGQPIQSRQDSASMPSVLQNAPLHDTAVATPTTAFVQPSASHGVHHRPVVASPSQAPVQSDSRGVHHGPEVATLSQAPVQPDSRGVHHGPEVATLSQAPVQPDSSGVHHGPEVATLSQAPVQPDSRGVHHGPEVATLSQAPVQSDSHGVHHRPVVATLPQAPPELSDSRGVHRGPVMASPSQAPVHSVHRGPVAASLSQAPVQSDSRGVYYHRSPVSWQTRIVVRQPSAGAFTIRNFVTGAQSSVFLSPPLCPRRLLTPGQAQLFRAPPAGQRYCRNPGLPAPFGVLPPPLAPLRRLPPLPMPHLGPQPLTPVFIRPPPPPPPHAPRHLIFYPKRRAGRACAEQRGRPLPPMLRSVRHYAPPRRPSFNAAVPPDVVAPRCQSGPRPCPNRRGRGVRRFHDPAVLQRDRQSHETRCNHGSRQGRARRGGILRSDAKPKKGHGGGMPRRERGFPVVDTSTADEVEESRPVSVPVSLLRDVDGRRRVDTSSADEDEESRPVSVPASPVCDVDGRRHVDTSPLDEDEEGLQILVPAPAVHGMEERRAVVEESGPVFVSAPPVSEVEEGRPFVPTTPVRWAEDGRPVDGTPLWCVDGIPSWLQIQDRIPVFVPASHMREVEERRPVVGTQPLDEVDETNQVFASEPTVNGVVETRPIVEESRPAVLERIPAFLPSPPVHGVEERRHAVDTPPVYAEKRRANSARSPVGERGQIQPAHWCSAPSFVPSNQSPSSLPPPNANPNKLSSASDTSLHEAGNEDYARVTVTLPGSEMTRCLADPASPAARAEGSRTGQEPSPTPGQLEPREHSRRAGTRRWSTGNLAKNVLWSTGSLAENGLWTTDDKNRLWSTGIIAENGQWSTDSQAEIGQATGGQVEKGQGSTGCQAQIGQATGGQVKNGQWSLGSPSDINMQSLVAGCLDSIQQDSLQQGSFQRDLCQQDSLQQDSFQQDSLHQGSFQQDTLLPQSHSVLSPRAQDPRMVQDPRMAQEPRIAQDQRMALDPRMAQYQLVALEPRMGQDPRIPRYVRMAQDPWMAQNPRAAHALWMAPDPRMAQDPRMAPDETPDEWMAPEPQVAVAGGPLPTDQPVVAVDTPFCGEQTVEAVEHPLCAEQTAEGATAPTDNQMQQLLSLQRRLMAASSSMRPEDGSRQQSMAASPAVFPENGVRQQSMLTFNCSYPENESWQHSIAASNALFRENGSRQQSMADSNVMYRENRSRQQLMADSNAMYREIVFRQQSMAATYGAYPENGSLQQLMAASNGAYPENGSLQQLMAASNGAYPENGSLQQLMAASNGAYPENGSLQQSMAAFNGAYPENGSLQQSMAASNGAYPENGSLQQLMAASNGAYPENGSLQQLMAASNGAYPENGSLQQLMAASNGAYPENGSLQQSMAASNGAYPDNGSLQQLMAASNGAYPENGSLQQSMAASNGAYPENGSLQQLIAAFNSAYPEKEEIVGFTASGAKVSDSEEQVIKRKSGTLPFPSGLSPNHSPGISPTGSPHMFRRNNPNPALGPPPHRQNTIPQKQQGTPGAIHQESVGGTTYFYNPDEFTPQSEGLTLPPFTMFHSTPAYLKHMKMKGPPTFFMADEIKAVLLTRQAMSYAACDPNINPEVPTEVDNYDNLVPLERSPSPNAPIKSILGYPSTCYRATHKKEGVLCCLRRIHNFRLNPSLNSKLITLVDTWNKLYHPNIVQLREAFTTKAFGDSSVVVSYDYLPGTETLMAQKFTASLQSMNGFTNEFTSSNSRSFNNQGGGASSTSKAPTETEIWSYIVQLCSALRCIHGSGLAARTIEPTKILQFGKGRLRVNCVGIMDILTLPTMDQGNLQNYIQHWQQEDLTGLGRIVLALACNSALAVQSQNFSHAMDIVSRNYSADLKNLIGYLFETRKPRSVNDLMPMIGARFFTQLDHAQLRGDMLLDELSKEVENGRITRLMMKLICVLERAEFSMDPAWSETGDRYMLKLFRDYVFHAVDEQGLPWMDMAHMVLCLNKLDAGVSEKIVLSSRDETSVFIVSYAELKRQFTQAFHELVTAGQAMSYS